MKRGKGGFLPVVRLLMMPLPGVSEDTCYGTPAFYVSKKLLARMKEDGETLVVYTPDRDEWTSRDNITFFITDHYKNHPYVLVNLGKVERRGCRHCWPRLGVTGRRRNYCSKVAGYKVTGEDGVYSKSLSPMMRVS